jgi:hypothetical protein
MWGNSKPMYSNFPYDTLFCIQMVVCKCKVVSCVKVVKYFLFRFRIWTLVYFSHCNEVILILQMCKHLFTFGNYQNITQLLK